VLEERRVQPVRPLRDQPLSVVTKFQADYDARTAPISEAAAKQHLQVWSTASMAALTARCMCVTAKTASEAGCCARFTSTKLC